MEERTRLDAEERRDVSWSCKRDRKRRMTRTRRRKEGSFWRQGRRGKNEVKRGEKKEEGCK